MSGVRLFKDDPDRGLKIWWIPTEDGFALKYVQDVEPILELNKRKQSAGRDYYAQDKDMWRVASIPITIQMEWMTKFGIDIHNDEHWPRVRKLLNSNEYRYLKTAEIII